MAVKSEGPNRIDWIIASALAVAAFLIYLSTLAPGILPGDSGEFQFAAWRLGLSHATGYPLYMLVGSLVQHLLAPLGISPAPSLNALSALFAALSTAVMYILVLDVPASSPITRRLVATFAASLLAVNAAFWSQAIIAEVYTLHALLLLLLLLALQCAVPSAGDVANTVRSRALVWAALIFGLSLAHHAMTILALPAVLLYLWSVDRSWWRMPIRTWLALLSALLLPLALYAYIPLRSGPTASPWYHQPLGDSTLSLYAGGWGAFVNFLTGRSISVGFHGLDPALANLSQASDLWLRHFGVLGLTLMALGIYLLAEQRRPFLWLTAGIAAAQQAFNLIYAIGDIAVYYIPLYVVGAIWAGYGAAYLSDGMWLRMNASGQAASSHSLRSGNAGALIALVLFLLPVNAFLENVDIVDQSANHAARNMWQPILAALPDGDAILVTNDRDEVPPFFYLQYVEGRAPQVTALHPLMAPDARFTDLGATIDTALYAADGTPVYLVKSMPGLEIKYRLEPAPPPLMRVAGIASQTPSVAVNQPLGGLTLAGYDWQPAADQIRVRLHWLVNSTPDTAYTTSVQLFDSAGERIAQSDQAPGGVYYPTSLWKPGERLVEEHVLALETPLPEGELVLQIGMYQVETLEQPDPPIRISIAANGAN